MSAFRHSIRQQTLDVQVDSETLALALQPHIGDINRQRFVPVIERVLDELAVPGQHVRIARLDIDLGDLPAGNFEQAAEEALYPALRRAVEDALRNARENPSPDHQIRPEASSRLDMIEHYLLRGTLPFWTRAEDFSAESLLLQLAESDPAGLVATLSRHAHDRRVLERLAFQLDPAALAALLRLLAPEHAALILAYMFDLRQIHRVAPLLTLSEAAFAHLLWVLVLSYVLHDPGTQFNRKSFVHSLLEGMAERAGLDYLDLLETLRRGLQATQQRHSLASSLPAIIAELERDLASTEQRSDASARDMEPGRAEAEPPADGPPAGAGSRLGLLAHYLLSGSLPPSARHRASLSIEQLVQALLVDDPDGFCALLREHGRQEHVLRRLIEPLGEPVLQRVVALLDAEHAASIIADMIALRQVHRMHALLKLSNDQFTRLLWILVLDYLLRDPGRHFDRASLLRLLLTGMAERETVDYVDLVAALRRGLRQTETHRPSISLLAVIHDLAGEIDLPPEGSPVDIADDFAGKVLAWFEHYLTTGKMPDSEPEASGLDPHGLFRLAVASDAAGAANLIRRLARSEPNRAALIERLLRDIGPREVAALLEPSHRTAIEKVIQDANRQAVEDGPNTHRRALWAAALDFLVDASSGVFDAAALAGRVAHAAAAGADMAPDAPHRSADRGWSDTEYQDRLGAAPGRAFERYDQIENLRHYLRHGLLPWGALLRDAGLSVERALALLTDLSPAQLRLVFAESPDEPWRLLERALRQLPEDRIVTMLASLLPRTQADGPFGSALASFAAQASDRPAFYARVIMALLDQAAVDLEKAAAESRPSPAPEPPRSESPEQWETPVLKSLLANRLRFGATVRPEGPASDEILQMLVARHADEARQFLEAIADAPDLRRALVQQVPPELLHSLLDRLYPAEASALRAIMDSLAASPLTLRPLTEERNGELFVQAVLRLARGPSAEIFVWLLRRLIAMPVTDELRQLLSRQVAAWRTSVGLPAAYLSAFETAIAGLDAEGAEAASDQVQTTPSGPSAALQEAVFAWLRDGHALPGTSRDRDMAGVPVLTDDALVYALERIIAADAEPVTTFVRQHAAYRERRQRWVGVLPDSALARMSYLLAPRRHSILLAAAEILVAAWREAAPAGQRPIADRSLLWNFLLDLMVAHGDGDLSHGRLVAAFFARTASSHPELAAQLFDHAGRLAEAAGNAGLLSVLNRDRSLLLNGRDSTALAGSAARRIQARKQENRSRQNERPRPRPDHGETAFRLRSDDQDTGGEPIYIANAGLVLTGPFLPHLFQTLDLLERDDNGRQRLRDRDSASRAVHLLQYLVDGRTGAPEPLLVLNKILCGVPVQAPIARAIEPTDTERALCESLLRAMTANWKIIENTSIAGLRETFLRREGKLQRVDDGWKLRVQRKTVDVLVDQIPWSIAVIFHAWMPEPIHVTW